MTDLASTPDHRNQLFLFLGSLGLPACFLICFFILPLGVVWLYSFGTTSGVVNIEIDGTVRNYARVFESLYLGIIMKSVFIAAVTTILCVAIGFPYAWLMSFVGSRTRGALLLAVMLPFWTNLLILTYALMAFLRAEGYINTAFGWIGVGPFPLLYNNAAVIIGLVYVHLPFAILPLYAALDKIDRSMIEASLDLGAGHFRTVFHIVVPACKAGLFSAVFITFIPALGAFLTPDLLGGPDGQMIASVIDRQFKRANNWPFGAALSFLLIYFTIAIILLRNYFDREKVAGAAH